MNNIIEFIFGKDVKLTPFDASFDLSVVVVGLVVVISALFILSLIISVFPYIFGTKQKKKTVKQEKVVNNDNSVKASMAAAEIEIPIAENVGDEELVAVITAAIAAGCGYSTVSNIRIKSIKRLPNSSSAWNSSARNEYITNL